MVATSTDVCHLGSNLRRLRLARRLSQRYVADVIDRCTSHVSHLETGRRTPVLEVALKLAAFFEVTVEELCSNPGSAQQTVSLATEPENP